MEFNDLANLIFEQLKPKLEISDGLAVFAKERSKFEGSVCAQKTKSDPQSYSVDISSNLIKYPSKN